MTIIIIAMIVNIFGAARILVFRTVSVSGNAQNFWKFFVKNTTTKLHLHIEKFIKTFNIMDYTSISEEIFWNLKMRYVIFFPLLFAISKFYIKFEMLALRFPRA